MKKLILSLLAIGATMTATAAGPTVWHDADTLPLIGKGIDSASTARRYQRVPDSLKTKVKRDAVYYLGTQPAGMAIRFSSNAPEIKAKWTSTYKVLMNHMTPTGTRGLDLYTLDADSTWTFVNTARPDLNNKTTEATIIGNMDPEMRDYMLYLSLYDGVDSLYIGVDSGYVVTAPVTDKLVGKEKPVVLYGTSIMQGGCANRPGMCHTNILMRRLGR